MRSSIRVIHSATLILMMVAGPALADQFDYTLFAGVEHSNNINLSNTAPVSQWVLAPGFGFNYTQQGATLQAHVTGAAEYRNYLGGAFSDQKLGELAGLANWTVLPERLDLVAQDYASVQPLSTLASNGPGNQQQTNVFSVGPTLHFSLGSATHGLAELRYINSRASRTPQFDSSRGDAALRVIRDVSPTSQLSLNVESQKIHFDEDSAADYRRDEGFVRYLSKLAHLDYDIAAGWSRLHIDGNAGVQRDSASGPLLRASVNWHASEHNAFGASYARGYSDAAQDLMTMVAPGQFDARATAPTSIQTGGAVLAGGVYQERRVEGSYVYNGELLTISLSPWYRKLHFLQGTQPDQTGHGINLGVDYRLSGRLTASAFANTERENYRTLARRDTTTNVGIGLRQQLNSHWSWNASLVDRHRSSTAAGSSYRAKEVYFGIIYKR